MPYPLAVSSLALSDVEQLHAALDHPRVDDFLGGPAVTTVPALRGRVRRLLAGPAPDDPAMAWLNFVVRRDDQVIGTLQATTYDGWAEVAWVFGSPFWGQGFGFEGASWLIAHLRDEHGLSEFWATVDPRNLASIAILRRLGFGEQPAPTRRAPASFDDGDMVFAWNADETG